MKHTILAEAYFALAQGAVSGRPGWIYKAHDACIHAREADLRGVYSERITDLEVRLAKLANENSFKSTLTRIESVAGPFKDGKSHTESGSDLLRSMHARS